MKLTTSLTLLSTLLTSAIAATTQTPPFRLRITSNSTSNTIHYALPYRMGSMTFKLTLTTSKDSATIWRLNTTTTSKDQGYLTTTGPYIPFTFKNGTTLPFAVTVSPRVGSNVAVLTFAPKMAEEQAGLTVFGIDEKKMLTIDGGDDDTDGQVLPPKWLGALRRWYKCKAQGYPGGVSPSGDIDVLAWVMGEEKAEDPSCVKVDVGVEMV
ncbi:heatshock protein Hsp150 [Venturia nashicola]|nr:heatshock protein Hsp150 [Venturia nashicola]